MRSIFSRGGALLAVALASGGASKGLAAGAKSNVEEGFPLTIESAYTLEYLGREAQFRGSYDRTDEGRSRYTVEPRLEAGVWWNTELTIAAPFLFGDDVEGDGLGPVNVEVTYNLNQDTLDLPAFSVAAGVDLPTGPTEEAEGYDPFVKLLVTKTLGRTWTFQQLHLNLEYQWNAEAGEEERDGRYVAAIGYSRLLNPDTLFVADFVREQDRERHAETNLLEAGLRYQLLPQGVISAGIGFGIGDESPDVRFALGFQYEF